MRNPYDYTNPESYIGKAVKAGVLTEEEHRFHNEVTAEDNRARIHGVPSAHPAEVRRKAYKIGKVARDFAKQRRGY